MLRTLSLTSEGGEEISLSKGLVTFKKRPLKRTLEIVAEVSFEVARKRSIIFPEKKITAGRLCPGVQP